MIDFNILDTSHAQDLKPTERANNSVLEVIEIDSEPIRLVLEEDTVSLSEEALNAYIERQENNSELNDIAYFTAQEEANLDSENELAEIVAPVEEEVLEEAEEVSIAAEEEEETSEESTTTEATATIEATIVSQTLSEDILLVV